MSTYTNYMRIPTVDTRDNSRMISRGYTNYTLKNIAILTLMVFFVIYFMNATENFGKKLHVKKVYSSSVIKEPAAIKNILFWNSFFSERDYSFGMGSDAFINHQCPVMDCFITDQRDVLPIDQYDAIVFHAPEFHPEKTDDFPRSRSDFQQYVYFSMESPLNRPTSDKLDNFFNLTMTYRLDSDVLNPYFQIVDDQGGIIAPSDDPLWIEDDISGAENISLYLEIVSKKSKPVAWFSSNCRSKNNREGRVKELQKYIQVDVYGSCGPLQCSRSNEKSCFDMLKNDYFFYLSYENSNCDDYITEKVSNALTSYVVPVVYGGANYSKFLPPGSYIDATKYSDEKLADRLNYLMNNPIEYVQYFWWKNFYRVYKFNQYAVSPFCALCERLHSESEGTKTYTGIKEWWHGDSNRSRCRAP